MPTTLDTMISGKIPRMSAYEVKLIVCGLSRAFFGSRNSVYLPIDGAYF